MHSKGAQKLNLKIFRKFLEDKVENRRLSGQDRQMIFHHQSLKKIKTDALLQSSEHFIQQNEDFGQGFEEVATSPFTEPPPGLTCAFCLEQGNHYSSDCTKVNDYNSRMEQLKKNVRCFRCLQPWFRLHQCQRSCRFCSNFNHHVAVCPRKFEVEIQNVVNSEPAPSLGIQSPSLKNIYMMTTKGNISSLEGREKLPVNIMLDTGSHRSCILSEAAGKLENVRENATEKKEIQLATFGSKETKSISSSMVQFQLETNEEPIPFIAREMPTITSPLLSTPIEIPEEAKSVLKVCQPINLTASPPMLYEVQFLIGMDNYHHFIKEPLIQLTENLYLYNTIIGPLIAGTAEEKASSSSELSQLETEETTMALDFESSKNFIQKQSFSVKKQVLAQKRCLKKSDHCSSRSSWKYRKKKSVFVALRSLLKESDALKHRKKRIRIQSLKFIHFSKGSSLKESSSWKRRKKKLHHRFQGPAIEALFSAGSVQTRATL